ncbi:MAG: hypothetical protein EBZ51_02220 [Synechococcaceae bacterium WB9_2_112]|nr:hypothetical protein [Synechococcaceae bacterium WB9_2_112]
MTPRRPPRAAAVLGALLLGGCSGTPFGDRLASSFSSAPQPIEQPRRQATTPAAAATPAKSATAVPANPDGPRLETTRPSPAPSRALAPAPYRITIRLPSGDPSAPAEVVTQALRAAGVPFEVEMIERIMPAAATGPSAPAPAPLPAPAPAPRSR